MARLLFSGWVLFFCWANSASECSSAEKTVRIRFAWGNGTTAKQRWTGTITVEGGELSDIQPLGVEADAAAAMRIDGSRLIVAPLEKRGFDGCDLTVRADEQALVRVELGSEQAPQATVLESPLAEVLSQQLRQPLDQLGSFFLAHRSPGDVLRVVPTREHFVFGPDDKWNLKLQPDLLAELAAGPVLLEVELRATGKAKPTWQASRKISEAADLGASVDFEIDCPAAEGAYRLTVTARHEEGFATRFVPGQQAKPIATRDIEFVVIDPAAKLPVLVDRWTPVLTIDPANPSWWRRLPTWAQVPRLRGGSPGMVGNIRPVVRATADGELVELPPAPLDGDPYWQAITLPVRELGQPHLVEIEYPQGAKQHLAISIIEPNAAGQVVTSHSDAGIYNITQDTTAEGQKAVHRFVFWPRTSSPQLLIVNRDLKAVGQFGKIYLRKQNAELTTLAGSQAKALSAHESERLVAGYLATPEWTECFGAAEVLDAESALSVQGWSTFLEGTRRLAQTLRLGGYNGLMVSVAADGSGLYPSQILNPSPRYDTGTLAASGQDPLRKDVLEMLLRVFDREGIRVVPTVQLAAPLPRLEAIRLASDMQSTGVSCIGYDGQSWLAQNRSSLGRAPYYNLLNGRVQEELHALIAELTARYGKHPALAGIGVQLSGEGYGLLPGVAWGLDDNTMAAFSRETGVALSGQGSQRFRERANRLIGQHREQWLGWRTEKLTQFYTQIAQRVTAERSDLRLILATEDLFTGPALQLRLRQSIANPTGLAEILGEHGLDLQGLNARPEIIALSAHRLGVADELQEQALDLCVNSAAAQGDILSSEQGMSGLFHHATKQFRLPSFDKRSPFGTEQTHLTVSSQPHPAGANQRRALVMALANSDAEILVEGGRHFSLGLHSEARSLLQATQKLPPQSSKTQTQRDQPVVMRVYRSGQTTTVALINESPWPVRADVKLAGKSSCDWQKLGAGQIASTADGSSELVGKLAAGESTWQIEMQPFDLQAWQFDDGNIRVSELKVALSDIAKQDLEQRIKAIESRTGNLNVERSYAQLQNPGFEFEEGGSRIVGWQPRQGPAGSVGLHAVAPHSGVHALRLLSEDATGVAVQSHLFSSPSTGQLLVSVWLRAGAMAPQARFQIAVQDSQGGHRYGPFSVLSREQLVGSEWSRYEFALSDVPFGKSDKLRLFFHLTGNAEVFVDDVQLYDLRFDAARRRTLVKRIYAARVALEQEQVVDCLRVVDDYWSRYLVEYVPPAEVVTFQAAKQPRATEIDAEEEGKGIKSRLRGWVPKMWR